MRLSSSDIGRPEADRSLHGQNGRMAILPSEAARRAKNMDVLSDVFMARHERQPDELHVNCYTREAMG